MKAWAGVCSEPYKRGLYACFVKRVQIQVLKSRRLGGLLPKFQQEAEEMLQPDMFSSTCGRTGFLGCAFLQCGYHTMCRGLSHEHGVTCARHCAIMMELETGSFPPRKMEASSHSESPPTPRPHPRVTLKRPICSVSVSISLFRAPCLRLLKSGQSLCRWCYSSLSHNHESPLPEFAVALSPAHRVSHCPELWRDGGHGSA